MLFDTGANGSLNFRDLESKLTEAVRSRCNVTVANKEKLVVGLDGKLNMCMINTAGGKGVTKGPTLIINTTTADVSMELFSFDELYRHGWG